VAARRYFTLLSRRVKKTASGLLNTSAADCCPTKATISSGWNSLLESPRRTPLRLSVASESGSVRSKTVLQTARKKFRRRSVSRSAQSAARLAAEAVTSSDWATLLTIPVAGDRANPSTRNIWASTRPKTSKSPCTLLMRKSCVQTPIMLFDLLVTVGANMLTATVALGIGTLGM